MDWLRVGVTTVCFHWSGILQPLSMAATIFDSNEHDVFRTIPTQFSLRPDYRVPVPLSGREKVFGFPEAGSSRLVTPPHPAGRNSFPDKQGFPCQ